MFDTLLEKLRTDRYITLETTPPKSPTFQGIIDKISALGLDTKVDGFTTTDCPLAKLKYSAILAAIKLQQAFDKPAIATLSMRDRNLIGLQSDILGANDFDIRAFLVVTGDPASMSDQPGVKGVFEGNSTELLRIIQYFNAGIDYAGKQLTQTPKPITPFAVTNSHAKNMSNIQKKMHRKIQNGARGIVTQPVYDLDHAKRLLELFNEAKEGFDDERKESQLILGFFPITRLKTAQFLASHVPGIYVPETWITRLFEANKISEEEEEKTGMAMSLELLKGLLAFHPKIHLMAANRFDVASKLLEEI